MTTARHSKAAPGAATQWEPMTAPKPEPLLPNDIGVAYILWFLMGVFGGHRYYLNRKGSAIAMTVISATLIGILVTSVWAVVDLFLIPRIFREERGL